MTPSRSQLGWSTLLLLAANVLVGGLNYLYQIRAAQTLAVAAFGSLDAWLAYLGLLLATCGTAQAHANFAPAATATLRRGAQIAVALGVGGGLLLALPGAEAALGPVGVALGTLPLALVFHWLLGQHQARTSFVPMGLLLIAGAVVKVAGAFGGVYYLALPASFAAGCVVGGIVTLWRLPPAATAPTTRSLPRVDLACAAVLSLAVVLVPQLDLFCLKVTQTAETFGHFARANLFARAVFYALATALQVLLPFQVQGDATGAADRRHLRLLETAAVAGALLLAVIGALLSPWISRTVLGLELGEAADWVLPDCIDATLLYAQLRTVQLRCARRHPGAAAWRLLVLGVGLGGCLALRPSVTPQTYLLCVMAGYGALTLYDLWHGRRAAAPRPSFDETTELRRAG